MEKIEKVKYFGQSLSGMGMAILLALIAVAQYQIIDNQLMAIELQKAQIALQTQGNTAQVMGNAIQQQQYDYQLQHK